MKLGDAAGLSYLNKRVKSGASYTYTVRALKSDGSYLSSYNTKGWTGKFIAAPDAPMLKNSDLGVIISWKKPAGAVNFRIFRRTGNGKWVKVGDTVGNALIDSTAKNGVTYSYTVRCLTANGKAYASGFNAKGNSVKCRR